MQGLQETISKREAKEALLRSGYLLESRLDAVLRERDYSVETNAAYQDLETSKSRELDLHASSAYQAGPDELDILWFDLLVECVNNPQPIAFITKEAELPLLDVPEIKLVGAPAKVHDAGIWKPLTEYLGTAKYHHYFKGLVSTQFCSFTKKKAGQEWMAWHDEDHFDSFLKLSAAVEDFISRDLKMAKFLGREVWLKFYYLVLVVQGTLLDVRSRGKSIRLTESDHVQYRRSAIKGGKETVYQVDVVREKHFSAYLDMIEHEVSKTVRLLRRRHKFIHEAVDKIIQGPVPGGRTRALLSHE